MTNKNEPKDRKFVEALSRGLRILEAFDHLNGPLGNQDIAKFTNLPKPTVTRMTYTLTKLGYLKYIENIEKYDLEPKSLIIGHAYISNLRIRQIAKPHMVELAKNFGVNIGLATPLATTMVFLEYCRGDQLQSLVADVGTQLPIASSANGRSYLAALPPKEREALLTELAELNGDEWDSLQPGLQESFEIFQSKGFSKSFGEWEKTINTVAVPVKLTNGSIFTISCGAPTYVADENQLIDIIGPRLVQIARDIQNSVN